MTLRRDMLDQLLSDINYHGSIIDIGGKKNNKRGSFSPPKNVSSWHYANIDKSTQPDFLCDAESIPAASNEYDMALLIEVIEHLEKPEQVIKEAYRLLKPGGMLVASIPFLYPLHADPYDFQRWSPSKINNVFTECGFKNINTVEMGGYFSVVHDLTSIRLLSASSKPNRFINRIIRKFILPAFKKIAIYLDNKYSSPQAKKICTGYIIKAFK